MYALYRTLAKIYIDLNLNWDDLIVISVILISGTYCTLLSVERACQSGAHAESAIVEDLHGHLEPLPDPAQHVVDRDVDVVEEHLRRVRRFDAHLLLRRPVRQAAKLPLDDECGHLEWEGGLSGSDRRERTVRSVLNGPSVLFYHNRDRSCMWFLHDRTG